MSFLGAAPEPDPPGPDAPSVVITPLFCVPCVVNARMHQGPPEDAPGVNLAQLVVNGTSVCDGHFEVKKQSGLLLPGGAG